MSYNALPKNLIFATTGHTQNLRFCSNFGSNLPPEGVRNRPNIYVSGKNNMTKYPKIQALSRFNFELKYNYFLRYMRFSSLKMGPKLKDQEVRGEVSTTFSEAPN